MGRQLLESGPYIFGTGRVRGRAAAVCGVAGAPAGAASRRVPNPT